MNFKLKYPIKDDKMSPLERIEQAFCALEDGEIYRCVMDEIEYCLIEKALERSQGNQILAARMLGLNRNTLRSKIRKFHIDPERFRSKDYGSNI